jgi:hypothetical protein
MGDGSVSRHPDLKPAMQDGGLEVLSNTEILSPAMRVLDWL